MKKEGPFEKIFVAVVLILLVYASVVISYKAVTVVKNDGPYLRYIFMI